MTAVPKRETMSADAFLEWAEAQDEGRYQLIGGEIVAMAPERVEHAHVKFQAAKALDAAISEAKLPYRAFVDGVGVKIDDSFVFEPDALVNRGAPIPRGSLIAPNPVIGQMPTIPLVGVGVDDGQHGRSEANEGVGSHAGRPAMVGAFVAEQWRRSNGTAAAYW